MMRHAVGVQYMHFGYDLGVTGVLRFAMECHSMKMKTVSVQDENAAVGCIKVYIVNSPIFQPQ